MTPTDVDGWIIAIWWFCMGCTALIGGLWAFLAFGEAVVRAFEHRKEKGEKR